MQAAKMGIEKQNWSALEKMNDNPSSKVTSVNLRIEPTDTQEVQSCETEEE